MEKIDSVLAVFTDHQAAERVIKKLAKDGFEMKNLSVIGKDYNSVVQYEKAFKADRFLVMAHGSVDEVARAKTILGTASPSRLDVHINTETKPAEKFARVGR